MLYQKNKAIKIVFAVGLTCCGFLFAAAHENLNELKIDRISPADQYGEPSCALVDLSYPSSAQNGTFLFKVNGKEADAEEVKEKIGDKVKQKTFLVYVGSPGKKKIEIAFQSEGFSALAKSSMDFRSSGDLVLLDFIDGEAVFEEPPLFFLSYFVKNIQIKVNGNETPFEFSSPFSHGVSSLVCIPKLKPGTNVIEYSGKKDNGAKFTHKFGMFLIMDGKVKAGDRFSYRLGEKNTASGPVYRLQVDESVLVSEKGGQEIMLATLNNSRWLRHVGVSYKVIKAKKPGTATLKVMKKNDPKSGVFKVDREIKITVEKKVK